MEGCTVCRDVQYYSNAETFMKDAGWACQKCCDAVRTTICSPTTILLQLVEEMRFTFGCWVVILGELSTFHARKQEENECIRPEI